jgi:hypothetical protein
LLNFARCRSNYRAAKATIRQQATKSRQLIAAVTDQLQLKDEEIKKVNKAKTFRALVSGCLRMVLPSCLSYLKTRKLNGKREKDLYGTCLRLLENGVAFLLV